MTTVVLVVVFVFAFLGIFVLYTKKCFARPVILTRQPAVDRRPGQKNGGLDLEFIETLPVVAYSAASMAKNCSECAVCLTEFQEGEVTRLLPKCSHAFHPECIDIWLFSHSTCPLCRISLISEAHTIAIHSNYSQRISVRQEHLESAAPVIEVGLGALSEAMVEMAGEREAVISRSGRSQSCRQTALEMDNRERLLATSARHSSCTTMDERSSSSRWTDKLRRSCSMEGYKLSAKVENPEYYAKLENPQYYAEPLVKE